MLRLSISARLIRAAVVAVLGLLLCDAPVEAQATGAAKPAGDPFAASVQRAAAAAPRPGDRIFLHVWGEQKLSDTVTVDERGQVLFPKIGIVNTASTSISALRDTVRLRFASFLRDSPVDIEVLRRVTVNGAVNKPAVYYFGVTTTVRDAIAQAGGISAEGKPDRVELFRGDQRIALRDWQTNASTNADLQSGDQLVVGRKSWFEMNSLSVISVATVVASLFISLRR